MVGKEGWEKQRGAWKNSWGDGRVPAKMEKQLRGVEEKP